MKKTVSSIHRRLGKVIPLCLIVVIVASCAHQPEPSAVDPPGFFAGLIHGFLMLFSFVGSWFTDVRIYAFPNSGVWYDLGYLLGVGASVGGSGASMQG